MRAILLVCALGVALAKPPVVDLSLTYNLDHRASHKVQVLEKDIDRIYIGVELAQICTSEHTGTHLQAPFTYREDGYSVDIIPIERLWKVPAVVVHITDWGYVNWPITTDFLQSWDQKHGPIPDGGVVLFHADRYYSERVPTEDEDELFLEQPHLTKEAAEWLTNYAALNGLEKGIYGVGTDLTTLDPDDSNATTSGRLYLYENNIYALHNLKNMNMLGPEGHVFSLSVMPMKIHNGKGAPARVIAEKNDPRQTTAEGCDDDDDDDDDTMDKGNRKKQWDLERDYIYPSSSKWGERYPVMMLASGEVKYVNNMAMVPVIIQVLMAFRG